MMPAKPVTYVQASVDLEAWSPKGPTGYGFHGHKGKVNIVMTDAFRDDVDPFVPLHAAALFARRMPGVKIHVYAKPAKSKGWDALLRRIKEDGNLGEVQGWTKGLANVYRAASFLLTAQEIDTRSVRESMACGCPVVRVSSLEGDWEKRMLEGLMSDRQGVRQVAEFLFDPKQSATQFKAVLDRVQVVKPLLKAV
jgi:glycosyltransferase involved in cell wall biosynthesis